MQSKKGFMLVELMIVVLILGILATIAIPRIKGGTFKANVNVCRTNVDRLNSQIELYNSNTGSWPVDLGEVTKDPNYFPDGPPICPFNEPYVLVTTKGKNRVPEHLHSEVEKVETIPKEEEEEEDD
jgi:prepilin-type N-terminal cleavage/methylation domain-containing protein